MIQSSSLDLKLNQLEQAVSAFNSPKYKPDIKKKKKKSIMSCWTAQPFNFTENQNAIIISNPNWSDDESEGNDSLPIFNVNHVTSISEKVAYERNL